MEVNMIRHRGVRRSVAGILMVTGGLLMLVSASIGNGLIVFVIGLAVEVIGVALDRRGGR
jgi:hypothetical protein